MSILSLAAGGTIAGPAKILRIVAQADAAPAEGVVHLKEYGTSGVTFINETVSSTANETAPMIDYGEATWIRDLFVTTVPTGWTILVTLA